MLTLSEIDRLENASRESKKTYENIIASKDLMIEDQASKISFITQEFENMLNVLLLIIIHSKHWQR